MNVEPSVVGELVGWEVVEVVDTPLAQAVATRAVAARRVSCRRIEAVYPNVGSTGQTVTANANDGEVGAMNAGERVATGELLERLGGLLARNVDGLPAALTHEMLVIGLCAQVNDGRAVPEVNMMKDAEPLENVDGSVDR